MKRTGIISIFLFFFVRSACAQQPFQWVLTSGPGTDSVKVLEINSNGDIIAGSNAALIRTSDHGAHWFAFPNSRFGYLSATATLPSGRIVILNDSNPKPTLVRFEADGSVRTLLSLSKPQTLAADRDGNLYCIVGTGTLNPNYPLGTDSVIAVSADAGDTWRTIMGPRSEALHCVAADPRCYYVTTGTGIYRSTDSGSSWKRCLNGVPTGSYFWIVAGHGGVVWASQGSLWFRSTDYGDTWIQAITTSSGPAERPAVRYDNTLLLSDGDEMRYVDDSGSHTLNISSLYYSHYHLVAVDSDGNWLTTSLGVPHLYISGSSPPTIWNPVPNPLSSPTDLLGAFGTVLCLSTYPDWLGPFTYSEMFILDTSKHWVPETTTNGPLTMDYYDNSLFRSTSIGGLYRSYDTGKTWTNIFASDPPAMTFIAARSAAELFASSRGLFISLDSGNSWNETNDNLLTGLTTAIAIDSSQILYVATGNHAFRSSDSGDTWKELSVPDTEVIDRIATNKSGTVVLTGLGPTVFRSTDHGTNWQSIMLPNTGQVTGVVLTRSDDILVSDSHGVFYWPANTSSFVDLSNGLQDRAVTALAAANGGALFAAVSGIGVWEATGSLPSSGAVEEHTPLPYGNAFPNPASALVQVVLPHAGNWHATATNVLGRRWSIHSTASGGIIQLDISALPTGTYELILRDGSEQKISPLEIIR